MTSKKSRCPNGSHRKPPKTGICVKKTGAKKKDVKKKTVKKKCPSTKLLNPKTNRCIVDNPSNRKKLGLSKLENNSKKVGLSTIHCNKYKNLKSLNLNKITLQSKNTQCNKQISSFSLSYVDGNKTIGLCDIKFLSKGAYGEVYEFSNRNYKVAIKTYKYSDDDEIKMIQDLNRRNIKCDIINAKVFKNGSKYITVMDLMNGPLSNMKGKLKTNEIFKVVKEIAKSLKCLNDKKLSYTDLKTDNILFKCNDKKYLQTVLGDLGSICKSGKSNACTWNPWEYRNELGFPKCNESTMVWCLGIVICELLDVGTDMFHWSEIPKKDRDDIERQIDMISLYKELHEVYVDKKKKITCEKLFKSMLNLDPKKRISLNQILKSIH